jgi:SAM-dependent methyltransferase
MPEQTRHDAWQAGDAYDRYMGRWSRRLAPRFLDWLAPSPGLDWLDVGCGTGALTEAILTHCAPHSLVAVEPSKGFLALAQSRLADSHCRFLQGSAEALPVETTSCDIASSGLMLNFVPDRAKALAEMRRVLRPGGTLTFYVWDYPGGGVQFLRAFWAAATALDPQVVDLTEDRRFPFCTAQGLADLARTAGLDAVACEAIAMPCLFRDFDDLWQPFTLGAGPAPGYCVSLPPEARERLRESLRESLPISADGSIALELRAWAVRGVSG